MSSSRNGKETFISTSVVGFFYLLHRREMESIKNWLGSMKAEMPLTFITSRCSVCTHNKELTVISAWNWHMEVLSCRRLPLLYKDSLMENFTTLDGSAKGPVLCILKLISWRKQINHSRAASASQQLMTPMSVIRVQKNRLIILDKETNGTFLFSGTEASRKIDA